jgi:hypothetical protein
MALTPQKVQAWADVGMLILTNGLASVTTITGIIKALRPTVTDAELNEIVRAVQDEMRRRKKISDDIVAAAGGG